MLKRLLGLCALALFPILAVSTMLAGGGDVPPASEAPEVAASAAPAEGTALEMLPVEIDPALELAWTNACGPECTTNEDCDAHCGVGFGWCSTHKRCNGKCLCGY